MNPLKAQYHIEQSQVRLSADRPVRLERLSVENAVRPHDHEFHEISLFTAGRITHVTSAGKTLIGVGDVVVVPPGSVHGFESPNDARTINVYFLPEWLDTDLRMLWDEPGIVPLFCSGSLVLLPGFGAKEISLSPTELQSAERELDQLIEELTRPQPGQAFMKSCFLKTLAIISRAWCRGDPAWQEMSFAPAVRQTLSAVERSIDLGEVFSVAGAAESAGLSPDRLTAVFRESVGYAPLMYFQRRRVQRACQLLADVRQSMTDIAMTLGYADAPHFSRLFKEHRGMTPREYRKTYVHSEQQATKNNVESQS